MADEQENTRSRGVAGELPGVGTIPLIVGPATTGEFNTLRAGLVPKACFSLEDSHFEFDSSFINPMGLTFDAGPLKNLLDQHPGFKLSIFGHTDPVGKDEYNKTLSGRRAQAVYGLLIRDTDLWADLYFHHDTQGKDPWGVRSIQIMLNIAGPTKAGRSDGTLDTNTRNALKDFEESNNPPSKGFDRKGEIDPGTFSKLARMYMDNICTDDDGKQFQLTRDDFIARGKGKDGKGDFQGCGEFNPLMMFSSKERAFFDKEENKTLRNKENQPNRRIMILLYRPSSLVDPNKWPCPSAKEGPAGCILRFHSDFKARRSNLDERREHKDEKAKPDMAGTFACRFYDRQTSDSPCERDISVTGKEFSLQLCDHTGNPLQDTPYELAFDDVKESGRTDAKGFTRVHSVKKTKVVVNLGPITFDAVFEPELQNDVKHVQSMLNALGFRAGPIDGVNGRRTTDAIIAFQKSKKLQPTGKADQKTVEELRKEHLLRARVGLEKESPAPTGSAKAFASSSDIVGEGGGKKEDPVTIKVSTDSKVKLAPPHDDLTKVLFDRYKDIDADKDGFASKQEIEKAIVDAGFSGDAGAMVATMWSTFGDFEDFSDDEWGIENDGITLADATAYDRLREKDPKNKTVRGVQGTFEFARAKIKAAGAKTVFVGQPDLARVQQGLIGDCYLLATLIGAVARNPQDVRNLITSKNPLGPFDVKFLGAAKAVTVPMPTDTETAIFSQANGMWLAILELAYAAHLFGDKFATSRSSAINQINQGRAIDATIPLVTGHSADTDDLTFTKRSETREKLKKAFANNKIVVAGVRQSIPAAFGLESLSDNRRDNGMPMGHAYAVLGFDSAKDEVKIRNPWGNPDGTKKLQVEDAFTLTLAEFESNFSRVAYEK